MYKIITSVILLLSVTGFGEGWNKYSAEANIKHDVTTESPSNFRNLEKPFRMAKLNILWSKAQLRLTEPKLKSLFSELKVHDKEELAWKRLKNDGLDKDGLKEAELRRKLTGIMSSYGLLEHFEDVTDPKKMKQHKSFNDASDDHINKSLFKDKKLNKLWDKAETSGFTVEELQALREEFNHHQEKIDQYYSLLKDVEEGPDDKHENTLDNTLERFNTIEEQEKTEKDYQDKANMLREKHRDIKDGYDRLHRLAAKGPNSKEFIEPKVQGLWKIATESNFSPDELESLRVELLHYENRLLKLRHLQAEAALGSERHAKKEKMAGEKTEGLQVMEETIKKQARKVEKLHLDLETRIMQKHVEL